MLDSSQHYFICITGANSPILKSKQLITHHLLEDVTLLGITSALSAYKLAWLINQTTRLKLAQAAAWRGETTGQATGHIVHFFYETEHCTFKLVKNRLVTDEQDTAAYLLSDLKHMDFFFAVRDLTQTFDVEAFCKALSATKRVIHVAHLDLAVYKDRAHFFFH